jgi:hypothetical protein
MDLIRTIFHVTLEREMLLVVSWILAMSLSMPPLDTNRAELMKFLLANKATSHGNLPSHTNHQ